MREIKFRAWDNDGKYFKPLEDDGDYYFRDDGDGLMLWDKWGECKNVTLLQFTGLKDKNGKEIYEGDILNEWEDTFPDERQTNLIVEYNAGAFYPVCMQPSTTFEIIGNVYETPTVKIE